MRFIASLITEFNEFLVKSSRQVVGWMEMLKVGRKTGASDEHSHLESIYRLDHSLEITEESRLIEI